MPQEVCTDVPTGPTPTAPVFSNAVPDSAIASCRNVNGALSSSVGVTAVTGGAFVPVNDAAVTLNTGILVYKECVLRQMVDAQRKDAIARLVKDSTNSFLNGRQVCTVDANGAQTCTTGPQFPENLAEDKGRLADTVVAQNINGTALNQINPLFQDPVKSAITRTYAQQTRNPGASLACPRTSTDLAAIHRGAYNGPQDLFTIANPNCNPIGAFFNAQNLVMSDVASQQNDMLTRLGWNNGVYDVTTVDAMGVTRVVTPGYLVAGTMQQQLGSSFRQLENANDIGQMIDQYFAGIGKQIMTGMVGNAVGGLRGLLSVNISTGQRSYMDNVIANTSAALQSSTASAAMQNLAAAVANETAYLAAKNATASLIPQAAAQLRGAENRCWALIIPPVMTYAQENGISRLKIATTTTASQAVIDRNLALLATSTVAQINISNATVNLINGIITGVNSANPSDAYAKLDAVVASGALHTAYDVQAAQKQAKDVQSALTAVVSDTITAWGDNQDPSVGWCNINNPALVASWANKWSKI
ncbi:MAG: hypothetical protein Q7S08_04660 [bacterium]|nr:hypothetical protein [bacterium]